MKIKNRIFHRQCKKFINGMLLAISRKSNGDLEK